MEGTYDLTLVVISFLIATVASYAALLISERIFSSEGQRIRYVWLSAGAISMGLGIWTMHFVGTLAFSLPIPVSYDATLTALSIVPAIFASGAALHFLKETQMSFWRLTLGGLLMASGIGTMHFTGMAAMIMNAELRFNPFLFIASIGVAHVLATLALYSKFVFSERISSALGSTNLVSAGVMGFSVCGMHYTAMASAFYFPGQVTGYEGSGLSKEFLAFATTLVTAIILGASILTTIIDKRLQEANNQVKLLLDSAGEGIYGLDLQGCTTFVNPAALRMLGWEPGALMGKPQHALTHYSYANGDPYPKEDCPIYTSIRDGKSHHVRNDVFWRKDGSSFPVEYISTPIKGPTGDINGAVVTFRDLTEQQQLEARVSLGQKMESIGQLAAGIAHEINTPTQFVSDNLRFLSESFGEIQKVLNAYEAVIQATPRAALDARLVESMETTLAEADLAYVSQEIPKALQQSLDGSERVGKIVRAMKEFSHPGNSEKKPVDLNQAIESTITVARNEWKYVAEMITDLDATLPLIPCLPGEFNQVILNVLINAAHAIGSAMEPESEAKGTITVTTQAIASGAEIRITDTGMGIPEAARKKIFDPFFTTKEVGKGTGQGLAIAHDVIVNKHGGHLSFESVIGQGTTFIIQLPT